MGRAILLTGHPGCGKTTLLRKIIERLPFPVHGFYTQEIRPSGVREGFEIVTLDGQHGILAHVSFPGPVKVGKYGVDLSVLEHLADRLLADLNAIYLHNPPAASRPYE
jgi:nucleoside-triphosphatase